MRARSQNIKKYENFFLVDFQNKTRTFFGDNIRNFLGWIFIFQD